MARFKKTKDTEIVLIQAGYRYALSLTHHVQEAEDLVQHACLKVLRNKGELVGKSYLFAAIRNLFFDSCRRQVEGSLEDVSESTIVAERQNHESRTDARLDLEQMLAFLSAAQREALFLNCVEGFSATEISRLTGQPRGTVLSHLSRAKQRLIELQNESERLGQI